MSFSKPRRKGNDGAQTHMVSSRPSALNKTLTRGYYEDLQKQIDARHVPKPEPKLKGANRRFSEKDVRACRALNKFSGWTPKEIAAALSWPYLRVWQILGYTTWQDIEPTEADVPKGLERPQVDSKRKQKERRAIEQPNPWRDAVLLELKERGIYKSEYGEHPTQAVLALLGDEYAKGALDAKD